MGSKQGENTPRSMDRRSFFKLGGLTAGAAALTGGMLAGCAPQNPTEMAQTGGENETVAASVPYAVYEPTSSSLAAASVPVSLCRKLARLARICW